MMAAKGKTITISQDAHARLNEKKRLMSVKQKRDLALNDVILALLDKCGDEL